MRSASGKAREVILILQWRFAFSTRKSVLRRHLRCRAAVEGFAPVMAIMTDGADKWFYAAAPALPMNDMPCDYEPVL